jgi:hypothetical protein
MAQLRRLKYVHSYVDRHGRPRHYFRRGAAKDVPLPDPVGSEAFMRAYQMALSGMPIERPALGAGRLLPGTVNALVVSYYDSQAWARLDEQTRKNRRRVIERFRERNGGKHLATLRREHVEAMLAEIKGAASARLHWYKTIKAMIKYGVPTMLRDDPTLGVATPQLPRSKGHHSWTDDEIAAFRAHWPLGTQARLTLEFCLETTSRRGEVVRLGPQHVRDGWIRIERTHGSADVCIPLSPALAAACAAMPKGHLTYIVTSYGAPRSKAGLGNDFAAWAREAGLPDRCRMHGLKKAGMRRLAEDGGTTHELMAISGHKTLSEVARYTRAADQRKLAASAMAKRSGSQSANAGLDNPTPGLASPAAKSLK